MHVEKCGERSVCDQAGYHLACRQTVDVGAAAKFGAGVVEDFMTPVDFTGVHGSEFPPVTGQPARFVQIMRRDETAAHQPEASQHRQPLGVGHVRFLPGHA